MEDQRNGVPDDIPAELLEELAASGAICPICGGLEIGNISAAITAIAKRKQTGLALPWCHCPACPVCGEFGKAVAALKASMGRGARMPVRVADDADPSGEPR